VPGDLPEGMLEAMAAAAEIPGELELVPYDLTLGYEFWSTGQSTRESPNGSCMS
jgi:hypothetical protein